MKEKFTTVTLLLIAASISLSFDSSISDKSFFDTVIENIEANLIKRNTKHLNLACASGTQPTASIFAIQASCDDGIVQSDGYLQISEYTNGDRYNFVTGSDYVAAGGDLDYINAFIIGALPFQFNTGLSNPDGSQDYTIRVFNGASDCFTDIVVTMQEQDCTIGCDCKNQVYLNDTDQHLVHKFQVQANGSLSEIGSPWLASGVIENPHGVVTDVNGRLYIAQAGGAEGNRIVQLDCDGNVLDFDFVVGDFGYNLITDGANIYSNGFPFNGYSLCDGSYLGCNGSWQANGWGLTVGPGGDWYATTGFNGANNRVGYGPLSSDYFEEPSCSAGTGNILIDTGSFPTTNNARPMGLVFDSADNLYVVVTEDNGLGASKIMKFSSTGVFISETVLDASADQIGWYGARGITYSASADMLYVASLDDCITVFNTSLVEQVAFKVPHVPATKPKAIGITKECCPTNNNITIDTMLCVASINDQVSLQELINCDGTICEGIWAQGGSNSGLTYNTCDNSVTITALDACGSFTLESDGTGNNPQCGAFKVEVNISVNVVTASVIAADQLVCAGGDPAAFTVTTPATGGTLTYQWQSSTTDCNSGFSDIASANNATYDPPAGLPTTTYYRVIVNSTNVGCSTGNCADTSNCVTVTIGANPTATATATDVTCLRISTVPNSDGMITVAGFAATDTYQYSTGSTFNTGSALPASPTTIPVDGIIANNLTNPTETQDYTVRITNTLGCYIDRVITLNEVICTLSIDYPDYSSSTNPCTDEPCHIISNDLYLGQGVSEEATAMTNETADSDDDDGVFIGAKMQITPGNTVRFPVTIYNNTGSPAYLRMWIDWNADGDFEDTGEQVENNTYPSTGVENTILVAVTIPINAAQMSSIALRIRLSTDDANSATPCGTGTCATDGEIEDYLIQLNCPAPVCLPVQLTRKSGKQ